VSLTETSIVADDRLWQVLTREEERRLRRVVGKRMILVLM
jgi:hypothetical protein